MLFLGIDAGTQGVRCMAVDEKGAARASASVPFVRLNTADTAAYPERREQRSEDWWLAAKEALGKMLAALKREGFRAEDITALSVDGTSGTVLALDDNGDALSGAIMYNDARASAQARQVQSAAQALASRLGYSFNAFYALPRLLWWKQERPEVFERTAHFVHHADFLSGKLSGQYVSDFSNALKTGYDFESERWPLYIEEDLHIPLSKLPRVVRPGTPIAPVTPDAAKETGLSTRTMVVAGATDGYASALATGAVSPGSFASIIGTTLVLKGVTRKLIFDPQGRVYCHKHPQGYYMPGGAGNVGGLVLRENFSETEYAALDAAAQRITPSGLVCYPLLGRGERFPFISERAEGFMLGAPQTREAHYTALLEGVGYVERLAYDVLDSLGADVGNVIHIAGGAAKSAVWSQIRADILNKTMVLSATEACLGGAMLAAMHIMGPLEQVAREMVRVTARFEPDAARHDAYNEGYARFTHEVRKRGYLS